MTTDFLKALHFLKKARQYLQNLEDLQFSMMTEKLEGYIKFMEEEIEEEEGRDENQ